MTYRARKTLMKRTAVAVIFVAVGGCGQEQGHSELSPPETAARPTSDGVENSDSPPAERVNSGPEIISARFEPERPTVSEKLRVVVEASDADGDLPWFSYRWTVDGESSSADSANLDLKGASKGEIIEVSVVASDGRDESTSFTARTVVANSPPEIRRLEIDPAGEIMAGGKIAARPEARDADGDSLTFRYSWTVNGRRTSERGPLFSTEGLRRGDVIRTAVVVSDGDDEGDPVETPDLLIANSPPVIVSRPGQPSPDGSFRYQVVAQDPDGDKEIQYYLEDAPDGMTVGHLSGMVSWSPTPGQTGNYTVAIVADDLHGGRRRQSFEVGVSADSKGSPPAASQR